MRRKQFRGNHKTALERGGNIIMKKRIISLAAAAVFVIGFAENEGLQGVPMFP